MKARNDYILALVSANAAIRKFFVDDQPELINVRIAVTGFCCNITKLRSLVLFFLFKQILCLISTHFHTLVAIYLHVSSCVQHNWD